MMTLDALTERSHGRCELCGAATALLPHELGGAPPGVEDGVLLCDRCEGQALGDEALEEAHWFCLKETAWTPVPAVQVLGLRILERLAASGAAWARDLAEQLGVDDDTRAWADAGARSGGAGESEPGDDTPTVDSNGTRLMDGDSVTLIQDLDVKGAGFVAKRGTLVKGIKLTGDPDNIEARVNKVVLVLKTKFLKKA